MARENNVCGHLDREYKAKGMCSSCYAKEHAKLNRDRELARKKEWYHNNRERNLAQNKEWRQNNPERRLAYVRRYRGLPTPTRPEPTACELCNQPCQQNKVLCIDHCHTTGQFRGWLCSKCNRGVGLLGDDLASIQRAAAYLQRNGEVDHRADDGVFGDC